MSVSTHMEAERTCLSGRSGDAAWHPGAFTYRAVQGRPVVYGYVTDNSGMGECGTMGLFHPRGRGPHHGAEPVVLPTSRGGSRPHLSPHPYRVARQATPHAPPAPRIQQEPTHMLQRTQALSRADP